MGNRVAEYSSWEMAMADTVHGKWQWLNTVFGKLVEHPTFFKVNFAIYA